MRNSASEWISAWPDGILKADRADDQPTEAIHGADDRSEDTQEDLKRRGDPERCRFGALQRDRLWCEFTEDDVENGDDRECNHEGDRWALMKAAFCRKDFFEERVEQRGQGWLANPAERQAGHRDPELRRGNVRVKVTQRAAHDTRAAVAFGHQFIDARLSDTDEGELSGDKEAVGGDEEKTERRRRSIPRLLPSSNIAGVWGILPLHSECPSPRSTVVPKDSSRDERQGMPYVPHSIHGCGGPVSRLPARMFWTGKNWSLRFCRCRFR